MRSHAIAYFAKIRISHVFPHIIAFSKSHMRKFAYMPHISHICRIFQCTFRQIVHIFPHILHQNGPHILRKISATNRHPYMTRHGLVMSLLAWSGLLYRALLSNGPGGPGTRAPELQGAPERLTCNFLLRHHKQNGRDSNGGAEHRINSEFST